MKLQVRSEASVNSLHWIKSLREGEDGTTQRVLEDLEPYLASKGVPFKVYEPTSAKGLLDILEHIEALARSGARPMIHFDTHGDKEEGLIVARSKECIPWEELGDCLRKVNIATENNLCVISALVSDFT